MQTRAGRALRRLHRAPGESWTKRSVARPTGGPDLGPCNAGCTSGPPARLIDQYPVQLYLFDLLHQARTRCSGFPIPGAGTAWRRWAWTLIRSGPRRGTATTRRSSWLPASGMAWRGWSASRWPPATIPAGAGTGSRPRSTVTRRSSSAGGSPGEGGCVRSGLCHRRASTTWPWPRYAGNDADGSPRKCSTQLLCGSWMGMPGPYQPVQHAGAAPVCTIAHWNQARVAGEAAFTRWTADRRRSYCQDLWIKIF